MSEAPGSGSRAGNILVGVGCFVGAPAVAFGAAMMALLMMAFMSDAGLEHRELAEAAFVGVMSGFVAIGLAGPVGAVGRFISVWRRGATIGALALGGIGLTLVLASFVIYGFAL